MYANKLQWTLVVAAFGFLVLAGCSSNKNQSDTSTSSSRAASPAATPVAEAELGEPAEVVTPAATVAGIWAQIDGEQGKLSAAIDNGQLKDVHHLAFGVRDLVAALADKMSAASPASAGRLAGLVAQVKASAAKLDELGDAGNLSGTQTEYAKLNAVLGTIKTLSGAK